MALVASRSSALACISLLQATLVLLHPLKHSVFPMRGRIRKEGNLNLNSLQTARCRAVDPATAAGESGDPTEGKEGGAEPWSKIL